MQSLANSGLTLYSVVCYLANATKQNTFLVKLEMLLKIAYHKTCRLARQNVRAFWQNRLLIFWLMQMVFYDCF